MPNIVSALHSMFILQRESPELAYRPVSIFDLDGKPILRVDISQIYICKGSVNELLKRPDSLSAYLECGNQGDLVNSNFGHLACTVKIRERDGIKMYYLKDRHAGKSWDISQETFESLVFHAGIRFASDFEESLFEHITKSVGAIMIRRKLANAEQPWISIPFSGC